jgi:hypothetical protein
MALLVPGGIAVAKKRPAKHVAVTIGITDVNDNGQINGFVGSNDPRCQSGRLVHVSRNGQEVGTATTSADGAWSFTTPIQGGDNLGARVDKLKFRATHNKKKKRRKTVCDPASTGASFVVFRLDVGITGNGRVDSDPAGINNCRESTGDCSAFFGSQGVTLVATPDSGESFTGYAGDCTGTNRTCNLTMNKDKAVAAGFSEGGNPPPPGACPVPDSVPEPIRAGLCLLIATLGG